MSDHTMKLEHPSSSLTVKIYVGFFEKVEGFQQERVESAVAWWLKHSPEI